MQCRSSAAIYVNFTASSMFSSAAPEFSAQGGAGGQPILKISWKSTHPFNRNVASRHATGSR